MKLTTNKFYLSFSLIGWILLFFTTLTLHKIFLVDNPSPERIKYVICEGITCGVVAYLLSILLAYVIDNYIDLNKIAKRDIYIVAIGFIIIQLLYSLIIWPVLDWVDFFEGSQDAISGKKMPFEYKLYINAPYFATLFFIWLFVSLTIKIYHQLKRVQLKQVSLEANLKESQLNTLKGQINPHFMFNSLNNIRGLILEDTKKSREMITRLSEMLRYSLTKNEINAIALEDELEMVDNYIAISKIQMEDRLQFDKKIEVNPYGIKIPPMIIQMLVENAAKHGIANLKNGGVISLNIKQEQKNLFIEVNNSGKLSIDSNSTQLGLKNIKQRLELLYKGSAHFSLAEKNNQVVATIQIPIV
ncbi:sensor histidine kinase [Pseudofulvibacter geojedonensis]|uniref:Sensor histidine kinase n=1 Tax=Pseudofulvibacter geojedonensis TaxID=1123758 RepID=A0ABW3I115_9FLAO